MSDSQNSALEAVAPGLNRLAELTHQPLSKDLESLLLKAREQQKWPVAQLISLFERNTQECVLARHQVMTYLDAHPALFAKQALILGFTGAPGAGKSSLIGELCLALHKTQPALAIAVLAIDPSSQDSGGALLGDRTRTLFPVNDQKLFFRSQASQQDLGGMSKQTFHVTRLLRRLFDLIIIETVGIGQSEIEIQRLSDHTCLVLQPLAGDQVQFMKAGIMEVPDTFIINKCDEDALARKSLNLLNASLKLAKLRSEPDALEPQKIFLTSATKHRGIQELVDYILTLEPDRARRSDPQEQQRYFLKKWIAQAYGEFGLAIFARHANQADASHPTFEEQQSRFLQYIANYLVQKT